MAISPKQRAFRAQILDAVEQATKRKPLNEILQEAGWGGDPKGMSRFVAFRKNLYGSATEIAKLEKWLNEQQTSELLSEREPQLSDAVLTESELHRLAGVFRKLSDALEDRHIPIETKRRWLRYEVMLLARIAPDFEEPSYGD